MVQLNRGRRLVQGVQSSNIQVNVPSFNALENPINVLGEIINSNDRQAQLSYERELQTKKDQISLLEGEIKAEQKATEALETEWLAQEETRKDNALTSAVIDLNNYAYDLSLKHHSSPADYVTQLDEYYAKVVEESGDWYDQTRALKFNEKFSSLKRSNHATINKNYLNKLNENTWDGITAVKNHSIIQAQQLIANIENPSDLSLYFQESNKIMQFLTDRIGSYETNVMGNAQNKKTAVDLQNVIAEFVYERDKAFISHFLTDFVMAEVTEENLAVANQILGIYEKGNLEDKDEIDRLMKQINPDFDISTADGLLEIFEYNTERYSGNVLLTPDQREDIINEAQGAIDSKYQEWREGVIKENTNLQSEINEGIEQAHAELTNLTSKVYNRAELKKIFQTYDKNTNTWSPDFEAIEKYELKQQSKQNFQELVQLRLQDNIDDKEFLKRANAIDLKTLGLEGDPMSIMKEYTVRLAFGDQNLDVVAITRDVFDEATMMNNVNLMNGLNVMKSEFHMPQEFLDYFSAAKNFDMKDETNQKHIVGMAILKNYAFGNSAPMGMDGDINQALNEVYIAYDKSKGNFGQASSKWALRLHPEFSHVSENIKNFNEWYENDQIQVYKGEKISGYDYMNNQISEVFELAVSRRKWEDLAGWIAMAKGKMWTGKDLDDLEFDNLVKNKNTSGMVDWFRSNIFGGENYTGENLSMATSVVDMMNRYVDQEIHRFLHTENMKGSDFHVALQSVIEDGIRHMGNNPDIAFSKILYVDGNPNGIVVTDQDPKKLIMNGEYDENIIMQNANAFIGKEILNEFAKNPNEASMMWFGVPASSLDVNDWDNFKRTYMSLWRENKIKLKPVNDTMNVENPSWHVYVDPDGDGLWRVMTKDGIPMEWFPNAQFTNSSKGFTYEETLDKWADNIIEGDALLDTSGWSDVYDFKDFGSEASAGTQWQDAFRIDVSDLKNASPEDRQTFKTLLKNMIKGEESWWNNLLAGSKWIDDSEINTVSEFQSLLTTQFDDYQKKIQEKMDFEFATKQEVVLMQHNMRFYPEKFNNAENEEDMINVSNQHNATMLDVYNDTFSIDNIGTIIPPNYAFVIKDIIASTDNWKELIGEGTAFYSELKNGNFRFAKNKLQRLSFYFNQIDREDQFNSWLNLWNVSYNK